MGKRSGVKSQVAGMFYPGTEHAMRQLVSQLLTQASVREDLPRARAYIVPHAGLIYSGSIAALAYRHLAMHASDIKRIVMIGPAHRMYVRGIALLDAPHYAIPGREFAIDQELRSVIMQDFAGQSECSNRAFLQEHCLEVQLPFLGEIFQEDVEIVPILVGYTDYQALAELLSAVPTDTLILISSDLSHFLTYEQARQLDGQANDAIMNLQPEAMSMDMACGRVGIQGLLAYAQTGSLIVNRLGQCNSGDTAGDKGRVVGYGAYHFGVGHA